jgi:hypothetical protein
MSVSPSGIERLFGESGCTADMHHSAQVAIKPKYWYIQTGSYSLLPNLSDFFLLGGPVSKSFEARLKPKHLYLDHVGPKGPFDPIVHGITYYYIVTTAAVCTCSWYRTASPRLLPVLASTPAPKPTTNVPDEANTTQIW